MSRTRLSLFYLASYLFIIGIGLLIAPHETLKILQSNGARLYDKQGDYIAAAIQKLNTLIRQSMPNQSAGQS